MTDILIREVLTACEQCITDFLEVYGRGASMTVLDEAVKSLRNDALANVRMALQASRKEQSNHNTNNDGQDAMNDQRTLKEDDWSTVIPRRISIWRFTPAEKAIHDAKQVVEAAGAHVLLTEALNLLHQAQNKVADFVDGRVDCSCNFVPCPHSPKLCGAAITEGKRDEADEPLYKYEIYIHSSPDGPIQIQGWFPINADRLREPWRVTEYIERGWMRKYQGNQEPVKLNQTGWGESL